MKLTKKSLLLAACVPLIAICALAFYLFQGQASTASINSALSLGQRYLDAADYDQALVQFGQALSLDSNSTQAVVGLAQVYAATGEEDSAKELLTYYDGSETNPDLLAALYNISETLGEDETALQLATTLANITDDAVWYEKKEAIISQLLSSPHPADAGTSHVAYLDGTTLMVEGSNAFGQLGLTSLEEIAKAQASTNAPQAQSVYCFGNATALVDSAGNLYVAGQNYTGQSGSDYSLLGTQSGFQAVDTQGAVITQVDGGAGYMLALDSQGNLWGSGSNTWGGFGTTTWTNHLTQVSGLSDLIYLEASTAMAIVLDASGTLYSAGSSTATSTWSAAVQNVLSASLYGNNIYYINSSGALCTTMYLDIPYNWVMDDAGNYLPEEGSFTNIAVSPLGLHILDSENTLHHLYWDDTYETETVYNVQALYSAGNGYVLVDSTGVTMENVYG